MRADLIRIGNSRGVRIPKALIEQCGLGESVDLVVDDNRLIIAPERRPREGWRDAFRSGGAPAGKLLLEGAAANEFDHGEWEW